MPVSRTALLLAAIHLFACEHADASAPVNAPAGAVNLQNAGLQDGDWGKFHSLRFHVHLPLPQGKAWTIRDRGEPELRATHAATHSRIELLMWREADLVNRDKCAAAAKQRGLFTEEKTVDSIDEELLAFPGQFDSRVRVFTYPGRAADSSFTLGDVVVIGGAIRQCLYVHFRTQVPSNGPGGTDERALSDRLALFRAKIFGKMTLDPAFDEPHIAPFPR